MCIFSFHLSDSFQELGISPNLGWIPSRPAGAEVPPRWQTLDGNKALSHRLALMHGSPVPTALAWCSQPPAGAGAAAPEPTGAALWGHILPGSALMELRNTYFEVWWGWQKQGYSFKAKYNTYWEIQIWKKNPTVFKTAEIAGVAGGCLPLKWFQLLQGEGFLYNYLQFQICLGLGFFGFLFLKSIQVTQRHARHHLTNLLLPRRLSRALHLLQRSEEV